MPANCQLVDIKLERLVKTHEIIDGATFIRNTLDKMPIELLRNRSTDEVPKPNQDKEYSDSVFSH